MSVSYTHLDVYKRQELNTVTLAALIVTLGMVVDDSVVIIDNYMEKLGHGIDVYKRQACQHKDWRYG